VQFQALLSHKLDVTIRWHDWQFLKKGIRKLINHWYLESPTDTQLIQLHLVGSAFSYDYGLCDIFQFILIRGGKLYGLLSTSMRTLCFLNQSLFQKWYQCPLNPKQKGWRQSLPPYFKIQLKAYCLLNTSLLRPLTSIQQLRASWVSLGLLGRIFLYHRSASLG
jgi:hypothetical protein